MQQRQGARRHVTVLSIHVVRSMRMARATCCTAVTPQANVREGWQARGSMRARSYSNQILLRMRHSRIAILTSGTSRLLRSKKLGVRHAPAQLRRQQRPVTSVPSILILLPTVARGGPHDDLCVRPSCENRGARGRSAAAQGWTTSSLTASPEHDNQSESALQTLRRIKQAVLISRYERRKHTLL
jgi:hypothetical protein